jgi:hypothetical protein
MMDAAASVEALDENMVVHASWPHRQLPGMRVRDDGSLPMRGSASLMPSAGSRSAGSDSRGG